MNKIKLKIAEIVILFKSRYPHQSRKDMDRQESFSERFRNFFYEGKEKPQIIIEVKIVKRLPSIKRKNLVFFTRHFQDKSENWYIFKENNHFVYYIPIKNKKQVIFVSKDFKKATAFVLPIRKRYIWRVTDLIYDFLHVLLIDYLSFYKKGIFIHAVGIKHDDKGILFVGKSGAGKTTTAKLWARHSPQTLILNDDRIIIRKKNNEIFIYGTPWHGAFYDYLSSRMEEAKLDKILFLFKSKHNYLRKVSSQKAFRLIYPTLLVPFWNKKELNNVLEFIQDLLKNVECFSFGFLKNKSSVEYIKAINERN